MDRTAAAPAASDEVVKKYTRELPKIGVFKQLVPADSGGGNGPSVPQTQQQQQSPSTLATVTQQQNPPAAAADDRFLRFD